MKFGNDFVSSGLVNLLDDQFSKIGGSKFRSWLFRPGKSSGPSTQFFKAR